MTTEKDKHIQEVLVRLKLNERNWTVVDYWPTLTNTIGIAQRGLPRRIVCFSYKEDLHTESGYIYHYECEDADGPKISDYMIETVDEVGTIEQLVEALEIHFQLRE